MALVHRDPFACQGEPPIPLSSRWALAVVFLDSPLLLCPSRQQYAQALAQQKAAALSSAPIQQQQQQQQQINVLLQQYQALKLRWDKLHCIHAGTRVTACVAVFYSLAMLACVFLLQLSVTDLVLLLFVLHRASESLLPPVTRSMSIPVSVPDTLPGSVWEMQSPSSQASCTPSLQQNVPCCESPCNLWGLGNVRGLCEVYLSSLRSVVGTGLKC